MRPPASAKENLDEGEPESSCRDIESSEDIEALAELDVELLSQTGTLAERLATSTARCASSLARTKAAAQRLYILA